MYIYKAHCVIVARVCFSAEDAKNVSWPWLSPLRGWGSLTMSLTGKFVYIYIYIHIIQKYIYQNKNKTVCKVTRHVQSKIQLFCLNKTFRHVISLHYSI